jgi:hypothetical protein
VIDWIIDQVGAFVLLVASVVLWGAIWVIWHIPVIFGSAITVIVIYGVLKFLLWLMHGVHHEGS